MPISDNLLLQLKEIGAEDIAKSLGSVATELEKLSDAERDLSEQNATLANRVDGITGGFSKAQAKLVTFQATISLVKEGIGIVDDLVDAAVGRYERYSRQVMLLSNNLGLSAAETSRLIQVSDDYGISIDTVTSALEMMVRRGTAPNIDELAKIADQYVAIKDPIKQAALMTELLGRGWTALTPLLRDGGQAIRENARAISDDLIITEADIRKTEELRKAKDALSDRVEGLSLKLGGMLAPAENQVVDSLSSWLEMLGPVNTEEEKLRQAIIIAANAFGQESYQVQELSKKLQDYLIIIKQVGMTEQERTLRASMGKIGALEPTPTGLEEMEPAKQAEAARAFTDYQAKLSDIEAKTAEARVKAVVEWSDSVTKLEAESGQKRADIISQFAADEAQRLSDMRDKQINILTSYSEAEQQITSQQNQARFKLAENYGVEAERMEAEHQRNMQRMSEDHGRNLRKLADSRDALAIEDEQETYEINRRRAEEDYQVQAAQKSEDYARQLADQNASFEQQRTARAKERDKQLADLSEQFTKQDEKYKAAYTKQLNDLAKSTEAQRQALWEAEQKKIADLNIAQAQERAQADTQWTQWRNEHEIFFAGEKRLYDDYLKYTADQLKAYIQGGGVVASTTPQVGPLPGARASGGAVNPFGVYTVGEHGPERLYMGRMGGYVAPNMGNITINPTINVPNANASSEEILQVVYRGIVDVVDKAMRQ